LFQPNKKQWWVIWVVAAALVLLWPAASGRSLAAKAVNLAADPRGSLPFLPPPIPMGLGDDADAVTAHDTQEAAYYDAYGSSAVIRARMAMRDWSDPLDPGTQRQLLIALAVIGTLLVWRLDDSKRRGSVEAEE
jgi:hypothetical protein